MKTPGYLIESRLLGGLWGGIVGDALGVPVEFTSRAARRVDPVKDLRSGGTWQQPLGTWSDDSSLALCSVESLIEGFDTHDMGRRFVDWMRAERWTPWGRVFDIGRATHDALGRISGGTLAERAGGTEESSNGNGSLMRILPVALASHGEPVDVMLDRVDRASKITHAHPRSQMACGFHCLVARGLLSGADRPTSYEYAIHEFNIRYQNLNWVKELEHFDRILSGGVADLPVSGVGSGGYVMETLTASLWCLLNSSGYSDSVLKAVNLGGDTDTTGCVTGGLAGIHFGLESIRKDWRKSLARAGDVDRLFNQFLEVFLELEKRK